MALTEKERCDLRLRCLVPFVETGSKLGLTKAEVFSSYTELAEKAFEFVTKDPGKKTG